MKHINDVEKIPHDVDPMLERTAMDMAYQTLYMINPRLRNKEYRMSLTNEQKNWVFKKLMQIRDDILESSITIEI